jgi:hypothetical protein
VTPFVAWLRLGVVTAGGHLARSRVTTRKSGAVGRGGQNVLMSALVGALNALVSMFTFFASAPTDWSPGI